MGDLSSVYFKVFHVQPKKCLDFFRRPNGRQFFQTKYYNTMFSIFSKRRRRKFSLFYARLAIFTFRKWVSREIFSDFPVHQIGVQPIFPKSTFYPDRRTAFFSHFRLYVQPKKHWLRARLFSFWSRPGESEESERSPELPSSPARFLSPTFQRASSSSFFFLEQTGRGI